MQTALCLLLVAFFGANPVWAEEAELVVTTSTALSVEAAIDEAMRRSPVILQAQSAVGEKHWRKYQAIATGFMPKLSVSAQHFFDKKYTVTGINFGATPLNFPGFYPTSQLALDLTIPVFDGFANIHKLSAASLTESAAEKELTYAQFSLSQEVRLAFYKALAAAELQRVAEQNVKTLEDHLRQINVQKQGGVATKYDTLRVEVQLSEAESEALDSKDNANMTRKKLAQLLGLEADSRPIVGTLPTPDTARVKSLEVGDVRGRADIEALNMRAQAADQNNSAEAVWFVPQVTLVGQYLFYNSQIFNQVVSDTGIYRGAYNAGVRLYWNLFDGGASLAGSNASFHQAAQADKQARIAKLQIPYDLAYWKKRYVANAHHYLSKKLDIARSEESVRLAKLEEKAGTRTASETLDALLDLFRARAGMVNAQVNAAEAQIRLELALGRKT